MSFTSVSTGFAFDQAGQNLARIQRELIESQRALGSTKRVNELKDVAADAAGIISARTMLAQAEGQKSRLGGLSGRLEVQDLALEQASTGINNLKQAFVKALSGNSSVGLEQALEDTFSQLRSSLNITYDGQYLFGGERTQSPVVLASTPEQLAALPDVESGLSAAHRAQEVQFGIGKSMELAGLASDFAAPALSALRNVQKSFGDGSWDFSSALTQDQRDALTSFISQLSDGHDSLVQEQGRNGQKLALLENETFLVQKRIDLATKTLGDKVDADVAAESVRISLLQTQYETAARTFSILRDLSLLNFLS